MKGRRAAITGLGVVAPGGVGGKAFWELLMSGTSATRTITHFDPHGFRSRIAKLDERAASVAASFRRQALHARTLGFEHPATKEAMRFDAPPPVDFSELRDALLH